MRPARGPGPGRVISPLAHRGRPAATAGRNPLRAAPSPRSRTPSVRPDTGSRNGYQPSPSSPASRTACGPSAAIWIGMSDVGRTPSRSGLLPPGIEDTMRPPSSNLRTCLVTAPSRSIGARNATSCSPSASWGLPAPSPRANRPPDTSARLVASIARLAALRPQTLITPESDADMAGCVGDLGQQHGNVVSPPLGHEQRRIAELLGPGGHLQHHLPPGLQRCDPDRQRSQRRLRGRCGASAGTPVLATGSGRYGSGRYRSDRPNLRNNGVARPNKPSPYISVGRGT